jgi:hypothetical protein
MQPKYVLMAGIAILTLLFGGVAWVFLGQGVGGVLGPDSSGGGAWDEDTYVPLGSTDTTGGTAEQHSVRKTKPREVNIDAAYQNLFVQLTANEVSFSSVSSPVGELGQLFALYSADVAQAKKDFPNAKYYAIDAALADLNSDGVSEAVVLKSLPGYCGTAGCPLEILQKKNGSWVTIASHLNEGSLAIANTVTKGYSDLFLSVSNEGSGQSEVWRYVWDGTGYKAAARVAVWTGATFIAAQ